MNYNTTASKQLEVALDVTPLLGPPTGVHQATAALIEALQHHNTVRVSGYVVSARAPRRSIEKLTTETGLAVTRSRFPAALCLLGWSRFSRPYLNRTIQHADIIHGTNYTAPSGSPHPYRPRLITVYDFGMITHPEWCTRTVRMMAPALRQAMASGAHLHVTTELDASKAVEILKADPARVHRITLGVRPLGPGDPEAARAIVKTERYVLALGTTEPRKNLHSLPQAVAPLDKDIKLVVAGPSGAGETALTKAVERHNLSDRYVRLPIVGEQLRSSLIRGASVLAYPSLMEGFGLPPLEAITVNTTVAATAVGVLPEILEPHIKLTTPGDDDAFADQLAELSRNPPGEHTETHIGKRVAELTWELTARRMEALYREIFITEKSS